MKKLISLLFVVFLSLQMWGATYSAYVYVVGSDNRSRCKVGVAKTADVTIGNYSAVASFTSCSQSSSFTAYYKVEVTDPNYTFAGWSTSSTYNSKYSTSLTCTKAASSATGGTALYVWLEEKVSNVTVAVAYATGSNNTMGTIGGGTTVAAGTNVTLTASANSNYTFMGWSTTQNGNSILSNSNVASYQVSASNATYYAVFEASSVAPSAGSKEEYTVTPGEHVRQQVANVSIPNFANAVDLGFDWLWANKNVGAASTSDRGTRYTWASAVALNSSTLGGDNWRMPTNNETENLTLSRCDVQKSGSYWYLTRSGYNDVQLIFFGDGAGAHYCWLSQASGKYFGVSGTSVIYCSTESSSSIEYWVRPVFDLAAAGIKKLTIQMVKDGVTSTNIYYCANNQQVDITPATVSGYNSSWTSGASGTGTKTFTVTSNTTATITYTEAITYVTATFNNYNGTQLAQYTNVVSGTTPTYSGVTPTRPNDQTESTVTTYEFTGWSPALGNITTNTTYTAQFSSSTTPRTYTIRFLMDDGETVLSTAQVVYNGSPIEPTEPTKIGTEEYSYNFTGWTPAVTAVTGDQDYVAVFEQVAKAPKYNLTIGAFTNGSVTLTANGKTDVVPVAGGTYQYEEGTTIIVKAVPAKGYHFNQWNDANTAASRQVSEIAANMTLTPTFAVNTPFLMDDTWEQAAFISNCAAATGVLTVTLKDRTYSAGQWATLSVPFNCTLDQEDELYNAVYRLNTLTLAQDGGSVSFEFIRTNVVTANEPYLIVPRHDISEVIFHGVTMTTPAEVSRTTDDRVTFVSGLWKQTITGPIEFYVATGNSLRYASSTGTTVKGNRAFFRKINDAASAPRRAIMVIDGEEVEVEIAGDAIEEVQDVRKYIENGVLIIERNGVRMDAQGKRID